MPVFSDLPNSILRCTACSSVGLENKEEGGLHCPKCNHHFSAQNSVPSFLSSSHNSFISELSKNLKPVESIPINNKVTTAANQIAYDTIFDDYDHHIKLITQAGFEWCGTNARIDNTLKKLAGNSEAGILIDLGCGGGHLLKTAGKYFNFPAGIDVSEKGLMLSRSLDMAVAQADILNIPLGNDSVNIVTGNSLLHHFHEPLEVFMEAYRVLKPGGHIYTDWDPYGKSFLMRLVSQKFFRKVYNLLIHTFALGGEAPDKALNHPLTHLAEYRSIYFNPSTGNFNLEELKNNIMKIGFSKVEIRFHSDCPDLFKNSTYDYFKNFLKAVRHFHIYGILSTIVGMLGLHPYFSIIAKK